MCVCVCVWKLYCFLLYLRDRQVRYLAGAVFICYSIFRGGGSGFYKKGFSAWRDFFPYFRTFGMDI